MPAARAATGIHAGSLRSNGAGAFLNLTLENKGAVRSLVCGIDLLSVELGEKYQGQRVIDLRWSVNKDVAHTDRKPAIIQPGRVIQTSEWKELDFDFGDRSPWT